MKVLIVLNSLKPTGTNIATKDLCDGLIRKKCEIDIISFAPFEKGDLHFENVRVINFLQVTNFDIYDVVYSSTFRSDIYVYLVKYIRKYICPKYITTMHNIMAEDLKYTYGTIISAVVSRIWMFVKNDFDKIVVSSEAMYNYYFNKLNNKEIEIIEYGRAINYIGDFKLSPSEDYAIQSLRKDYVIIGTIGSLTLRKNYGVVIDVLERYPNFAWVCLGEGDQREELEQRAENIGIRDRIIFLGYKIDSRPFYKYFDVFFHPSKSEGFPLVIIDSLANQTLIIVPKLFVYTSILNDDVVLYYEVDNLESMMDAFAEFLGSRPKLIEKTQKAFLLYQDRFSLTKYSDKYFELFTNINSK